MKDGRKESEMSAMINEVALFLLCHRVHGISGLAALIHLRGHRWSDGMFGICDLHKTFLSCDGWNRHHL